MSRDLRYIYDVINYFRGAMTGGDRVEIIVTPKEENDKYVDSDERTITIGLQGGLSRDRRSFHVSNGREFDLQILPLLLNYYSTEDNFRPDWDITEPTFSEHTYKARLETESGNLLYIETFDSELFDNLRNFQTVSPPTQNKFTVNQLFWERLIECAKKRASTRDVLGDERLTDDEKKSLDQFLDVFGKSRLLVSSNGNVVQKLAPKRLKKLFDATSYSPDLNITEEEYNWFKNNLSSSLIERIDEDMLDKLAVALRGETRFNQFIDTRFQELGLTAEEIADRRIFVFNELHRERINYFGVGGGSRSSKIAKLEKIYTTNPIPENLTEEQVQRYLGYCSEIRSYIDASLTRNKRSVDTQIYPEQTGVSFTEISSDEFNMEFDSLIDSIRMCKESRVNNETFELIIEADPQNKNKRLVRVALLNGISRRDNFNFTFESDTFDKRIPELLSLVREDDEFVKVSTTPSVVSNMERETTYIQTEENNEILLKLPVGLDLGLSETPVEPTPDPVEPVVTPVEPTPEPVETVVTPVEPTPEPVETVVTPVEPTPEPVETVVTPVEPTPEPVETVVTPLEPTPEPVETVVMPVEPTPEPVETVVTPVEPTPEPVETVVTPVEPTPEPVETVVMPVEPTPEPVKPVVDPSVISDDQMLQNLIATIDLVKNGRVNGETYEIVIDRGLSDSDKREVRITLVGGIARDSFSFVFNNGLAFDERISQIFGKVCSDDKISTVKTTSTGLIERTKDSISLFTTKSGNEILLRYSIPNKLEISDYLDDKKVEEGLNRSNREVIEYFRLNLLREVGKLPEIENTRLNDLIRGNDDLQFIEGLRVKLINGEINGHEFESRVESIARHIPRGVILDIVDRAMSRKKSSVLVDEKISITRDKDTIKADEGISLDSSKKSTSADVLKSLAQQIKDYLPVPEKSVEVPIVEENKYFEELHDLVIKYKIFNVGGELKVFLRENSEEYKVTEEEKIKIQFAHFWASMAGVRSSAGDLIPGEKHAFGDDSRNLFNIMSVQFIESIKKGISVDFDSLRREFDNSGYNMANDVFNRLFKNEDHINLIRTYYELQLQKEKLPENQPVNIDDKMERHQLALSASDRELADYFKKDILRSKGLLSQEEVLEIEELSRRDKRVSELEKARKGLEEKSLTRREYDRIRDRYRIQLAEAIKNAESQTISTDEEVIEESTKDKIKSELIRVFGSILNKKKVEDTVAIEEQVQVPEEVVRSHNIQDVVRMEPEVHKTDEELRREEVINAYEQLRREQLSERTIPIDVRADFGEEDRLLREEVRRAVREAIAEKKEAENATVVEEQVQVPEEVVRSHNIKDVVRMEPEVHKTDEELRREEVINAYEQLRREQLSERTIPIDVRADFGEEDRLLREEVRRAVREAIAKKEKTVEEELQSQVVEEESAFEKTDVEVDDNDLIITELRDAYEVADGYSTLDKSASLKIFFPRENPEIGQVIISHGATNDETVLFDREVPRDLLMTEMLPEICRVYVENSGSSRTETFEVPNTNKAGLISLGRNDNLLQVSNATKEEVKFVQEQLELAKVNMETAVRSDSRIM